MDVMWSGCGVCVDVDEVAMGPAAMAKDSPALATEAKKLTKHLRRSYHRKSPAVTHFFLSPAFIIGEMHPRDKNQVKAVQSTMSNLVAIHGAVAHCLHVLFLFTSQSLVDFPHLAHCAARKQRALLLSVVSSAHPPGTAIPRGVPSPRVLSWL